MERNQFTFYRSFYEAIRRIRKDGDRAKAYDAICSYALYGTEPDMDKLPDAAAIAFDLIKPNLDASKRKAESGKRGGSEKQTGSKPEANEKQIASKPEASRNQEEAISEKEKEKENKKEKEIENKCYPPTPLRGGDTPTLEQVTEFAKMRKAPVDPKVFWDYYNAAGWRDSEGKPVYNWQQKFISWELRESQKPSKPGGTVTEPPRPKIPGENMARMREYLKQAKEGQG